MCIGGYQFTSKYSSSDDEKTPTLAGFRTRCNDSANKDAGIYIRMYATAICDKFQ